MLPPGLLLVHWPRRADRQASIGSAGGSKSGLPPCIPSRRAEGHRPGAFVVDRPANILGGAWATSRPIGRDRRSPPGSTRESGRSAPGQFPPQGDLARLLVDDL